MNKRQLTTPPAAPKTWETRQGTYLYGGVLKDHFGHAITEGIARFWALDMIEESAFQSIIFFPKRRGEDPKVLGVVDQLKRLFGFSLPIEIIHQPTQFERLCVPGQGYGLGEISVGTPEFQALVRNRFAQAIPDSPSQKLYLSRGGMGPLNGGAFNEADLETALSKNGYRIFRPEEHPLDEQVAAIKAATHVLGLEGSAFHLASLVCRTDQKVGIISRDLKNLAVTREMAGQISALDPSKDVQILTTIMAFYRKSNLRRGVRSGMAVLDVPQLLEKLQGSGFIDDVPAVPHNDDVLLRAQSFVAEQEEAYDLWQDESATPDTNIS